MVITSHFSYAEHKEIRFTISTNPFKPFLGIASIEFEIGLSEHYSAHIFFEKKFTEKIDHPDYVMKLGTRYYLLPPDGFQSKTFLGLNIAYATSKKHFDGDGISLGSELGYKYLLKNKISIVPTLHAHYLFD